MYKFLRDFPSTNPRSDCDKCAQLGGKLKKMNSDVQETQDHRVRVGNQRRQKTRLKLLEAALGVLAQKPLESVVIEDFIAAAGISRGTFYNYFKTTHELLLALASELSDEILAAVDPLVLQCENPVQRFAMGTRLYMRVAARYPLWGSFLNSVGTRIATRGQLIEKYLTRDLSDALKAGLIKVDNVLLARDLVLGSIFYGIETMVTSQTSVDHPEHLIKSILRGLCVPEEDLDAIAFMPIPTLDDISGPIISSMKPKEDGKKGKRKKGVTPNAQQRTGKA